MALPFPFTFVSRQPGAPLRRCVERIWYARGTVPYARERIAPTGSAVAVVVLGDPIVQIADNGAGEELVAERGFLVGPHDRPTINAPTGETHAVGIVTTAVGCEAVFGIRPAILRGRTVDLKGAWPSASTLRAALLATSGPEAALDAVERHLQARTGPVRSRTDPARGPDGGGGRAERVHRLGARGLRVRAPGDADGRQWRIQVGAVLQSGRVAHRRRQCLVRDRRGALPQRRPDGPDHPGGSQRPNLRRPAPGPVPNWTSAG